MTTRKIGLFEELAGPGFPRPVGRRRTFIEWVFHTAFRMTCFAISLMALAFLAIAGGMLLLVVVGILA